jgi:hypothetical protein
MLKPKEVLDNYYLEARCQLLEIAAMLDRYDRSQDDSTSVEDDGRVDLVYESLALLSQRDASPDRSEKLLNLFTDPE